MFEKGTRLGVRFNSVAGQLTIEDLWRLKLTSGKANLDSVAKLVNKELNQSKEESFVVAKSSVSEIAELKMSIVKHIITVKLEEKDKILNASKTKQEKEKLLSILDRKKNAKLEDMSEAELEAKLAELG